MSWQCHKYICLDDAVPSGASEKLGISGKFVPFPCFFFFFSMKVESLWIFSFSFLLLWSFFYCLDILPPFCKSKEEQVSSRLLTRSEYEKTTSIVMTFVFFVFFLWGGGGRLGVPEIEFRKGVRFTSPGGYRLGAAYPGLFQNMWVSASKLMSRHCIPVHSKKKT